MRAVRCIGALIRVPAGLGLQFWGTHLAGSVQVHEAEIRLALREPYGLVRLTQRLQPQRGANSVSAPRMHAALGGSSP